MKTTSLSLWAKCRHIVTITSAAILAFNVTSSQGATPFPMSGSNYSENFGDIANWTDNFASGIGASYWGSVPVQGTATIPDPTHETTATDTFKTSGTGGVQKGTGSIVLLSTGTTDNSAAAAIDLFLDFTGATNGILNFDFAKVDNGSGARGGTVRVYATADGTTFSQLASVTVTNNWGPGGTNTAYSGTISGLSLPANFNNNANARLRFYYYNGPTGQAATGSRPKISIDSVSVTAARGAQPATQVRVETAADGNGSVVSAQNIAAGTSLTVYAIARSAGGAFVANTNATWALLGKTGGAVDGDLVTAGDSKSATFTGHVVGTAVIDATVAGFSNTDSGTITVTNGPATQLRIETQANGNGTVIGTQTLASGNSLVARSIRRDAYGNFVDNVAADSWSLTGISGSVVAGDLVADGAMKFATFTGNGAGTGIITATSGALTGNSGTITVSQIPPTITANPTSVTTNSGVNVTFFVNVSGSTPITYQWKKNGNNLSGQNGASLTLSNVTKLDEGSYSVGVTNAASGLESATATLTLNVNAFTLMTYNVKGNFSADWDMAHPQVQALGRQLQYLQPDIITFNEIPNGSNATLNALISTYLPGYTSTQTDAATDGGIRSAIVSRWPIISSNSFFHNLDLTAWGAAGQTYTRDLYVAKIQVPGMSKPLDVATTHLKSNGTQPDSCIRRAAEANVVSNFFYNFRQTNTDYFIVTGDWNQDIWNNDACNPTNKPADSITASNFTGLFLTTPVDPNSPGGATNYFTHSIQGTFSHRYDYIAPCGTLYTNINASKVFRTSTLPDLTGTGLSANDDATTSDHLPVLMSFNNPETSSPTFATQPASTTAAASSTVVFSVVAGGATPLTYHWYKGNTPLSDGTTGSGSVITGSTTASLTITGVLAPDAGTYKVNVTNLLGSATSSNAVLTVTDPAILTNPAHQTNAVGAQVVFTASAAGTAPLTYQWQKGGANLTDGGTIVGSTTTALTIC